MPSYIPPHKACHQVILFVDEQMRKRKMKQRTMEQLSGVSRDTLLNAKKSGRMLLMDAEALLNCLGFRLSIQAIEEIGNEEVRDDRNSYSNFERMHELQS